MNEALKNLVEETLDLPFDNLKFKKLVSNIFKKSFDENSHPITVAEKFKKYTKNI